MFQRILVALGTSSEGRDIFEQALIMAKKTNAKLMLLHVLSNEEEKVPNLPHYALLVNYPLVDVEALDQYQKEWEAYVQESLTQLHGLQKEAETAGITAEITQASGDPGVRVCELAEVWRADVVVMGSRQRQGLTEFLLGSVSNHVLHHAHCSVLIVRGKVLTWERILVALDSSDSHRQVFHEALPLATAMGAHLRLLHILWGGEEASPSLPTAPMLEYYPVYPGALKLYQQQWKRYEEFGHTLLNTLETEARQKEVPTESLQNMGSPSLVICEAAKSWPAQLIVMGRRGHSGLKELFVGSVSNYVVHHAVCSILVIQEKAPKKEIKETPPAQPTINATQLDIPFDQSAFLARVQRISEQVSVELMVFPVHGDVCRVLVPGRDTQVWVKAAYQGDHFQVFQGKDQPEPPTILNEIYPTGEAFLTQTLSGYVGFPMLL